MDALDLDVRRHVYFSVVANGRPPTAGEAAAASDREVVELEECYRRLHDAHALVLFPESLDPGWRPRSADDSQTILERLGLTGDFWAL